MNKYDKIAKFKRIEQNKRRMDMHDAIHVNCIRINSGESLKHFLIKAWKCYDLKALNIPFITEGHLDKMGGRIPDIFTLDKGELIEVETFKSNTKPDADQTFIVSEEIKKLKEVI